MIYTLQSFSQNELAIQKPHKQDSAKYERNKAISIEFGNHFLLATQSCISRYRGKGKGEDDHEQYIKFPVDTIENYANDLIINRRYLPTLSVDFNFHDHKLILEASYTNFKNKFSYGFDYFRAAHFYSKEYYILIGYSYNHLYGKTMKSINRRSRFYITANILFQHKEREFYYSGSYVFPGGNMTSRTLNEKSSSIQLTILSDVGLKVNITKNIYFKLGFNINCVSYLNGNYSWNYKTSSGPIQPVHTYSEDKGIYNKIMYPQENKYFILFDNVFLKLGYSFCPYKKKGN